jgi:uncharacterized protein
MKVVFDIGHPAQVHFHKNTIRKIIEDGHEVLVTARNKDVLVDLLDLNGLDYQKISDQRFGFFGLSYELLERILNLTRVVRRVRPDLICGPGETVAIVGKITGTPVLLFNDSEPVPINRFMTYPFVDTICTPSTFRNDLGPKQIRYDGYKELAYLHPNVFTPDPSVLDLLGLTPEEPFIIVRFVSWQARHDVGRVGIQDKEAVIEELTSLAPVFISSEATLPRSLEKYCLRLPPDRLHDLLNYARLLFTDSQTMTTEAAVLGTPAIRCNSFAGDNDMGNFVELENEFNLIFNFDDVVPALAKARELFAMQDLKGVWTLRRDEMLKKKIDVTAFNVWLIEHYPNSVARLRTDPGLQSMFLSEARAHHGE